MKIVIPQNQKPVRSLMEQAGWTPIFEEIRSNIGIVTENGSPIIQLRSMDALRTVASGKADVGFVGSDCVADKPSWAVKSLNAFSFGRAIDAQKPRLEIVSSESSPIFSMKDVRQGSIFLSERPTVTYRYLTDLGFPVEIEQDQNPNDFRVELIRNGKVGICIIQGTSPVQLEPGNDLGVMVNETGRTVTGYNLKVIAKICDIETILIVNPNSLQNKNTREQILKFQRDLESAYKQIEKELSGMSKETTSFQNNRARL